jgi:hypothetical protein
MRRPGLLFVLALVYPFFLVAVYFWGVGGTPTRASDGTDTRMIDDGRDNNDGLLELKRQLGVSMGVEVPGNGGHASDLTMKYFIDDDDERNRGILLLLEPAEETCFADGIPGTQPFPIPPRAPLYAGDLICVRGRVRRGAQHEQGDHYAVGQGRYISQACVEAVVCVCCGACPGRGGRQLHEPVVHRLDRDAGGVFKVYGCEIPDVGDP